MSPAVAGQSQSEDRLWQWRSDVKLCKCVGNAIGDSGCRIGQRAVKIEQNIRDQCL